MADVLSPGGQWRWDEAAQDWVPNTSAAPQTQNNQGFTAESFKKAAMEDFIATGGKNLSKIKAAQDLIAPEVKAEEKEDTSDLDATTNLINSLEQKFQAAKGGEYTGAGARLSGTQKSIMALLGLDDSSKTYKDQKEGFASSLKELTGDTGVLTDQDYARLAKLLPGLGSTPGEAKTKFEDIRKQIAASYGKEAQETTYKAPESKGGLLSFLAPNVDQGVKTLKNYPQSLVQAGQEIQEEGALGKPSAKLLSMLTPGAKEEDFGENRLTNAITSGYKTTASSQGAANDIANPLLLMGMLKNGFKKIAGGTVKGALEKRVVAAENTTAKVSGENVFNKAKEMVEKAGSETDLPQARKLLEQSKELVGKEFDAPTILEKLAQYNKAYTTSGASGKSAKALVNDALSKAVRAELSTVAPDVAVAQEALKSALGRQKFAKGIGRQIVSTGVGIGAGGIIATLLGKRSGGQ